MASRTLELIAELKASWEQPNAGRNLVSDKPLVPLARTPQDQTVPPGIAHPQWEIVRWLPAAPPWYGGGMLELDGAPTEFAGGLGRFYELGAGRVTLAKRYAWSIISPGDVQWMVDQLDGRAVVEVGAGTGYWAWQLEQAGVDVAAYDPHPPGPDNNYCKHGPYTTVLQDGAEAAAHHPDRALLMVWPPYDGEHARHALSVYRGDLLLYAGEGWGGCTADDGFYELLNAEWTEVGESPHHVTWQGIHCSLTAYRRTSTLEG